MKRLIVPAALVAAVLGVTLFSATGSAKPSKGTNLTVIERDSESNFRFIDNPPRAQRAAACPEPPTRRAARRANARRRG